MLGVDDDDDSEEEKETQDIDMDAIEREMTQKYQNNQVPTERVTDILPSGDSSSSEFDLEEEEIG